MLCVLDRLLGLLFKYSEGGTYSRAAPRLLNTCVTGYSELGSTIVFSIYLALKTNLVQRMTLIAYLLNLLTVTSNHS